MTDLAPLHPVAVKALTEAGYTSWPEILQLTNKQLESIRRLGPAALAAIQRMREREAA